MKRNVIETDKQLQDITNNNISECNKYFSDDFRQFFYNIYVQMLKSGKAISVDKNYFLTVIVFNMLMIIKCFKSPKFLQHKIMYQILNSEINSNFVLIFYFKILNISIKMFNDFLTSNDLTNFIFIALISEYDEDYIIKLLGNFSEKFVKYNFNKNDNTITNSVNSMSIETFPKFYNKGMFVDEDDLHEHLFNSLALNFKGYEGDILYIIKEFNIKTTYKNIDEMFKKKEDEPTEIIKLSGIDLPLFDTDDKSLVLFSSLKRQEEELKNIAELIKKGQTTPQEYVQNILSKPELLNNVKRLALEHPAIFNELNKMGVLSLLKGEISPNQLTQITNLQSEIRPFIIDGKYKLKANKIIQNKINNIVRKKY